MRARKRPELIGFPLITASCAGESRTGLPGSCAIRLGSTGGAVTGTASPGFTFRNCWGRMGPPLCKVATLTAFTQFEAPAGHGFAGGKRPAPKPPPVTGGRGTQPTQPGPEYQFTTAGLQPQ